MAKLLNRYCLTVSIKSIISQNKYKERERERVCVKKKEGHSFLYIGMVPTLTTSFVIDAIISFTQGSPSKRKIPTESFKSRKKIKCALEPYFDAVADDHSSTIPSADN